MEKIYWKQKDGKLINVDNMTIEHLRNTLKMIIRNTTAKVKKPKRDSIIDKFEEERMKEIEEEWDEDISYYMHD